MIAKNHCPEHSDIAAEVRRLRNWIVWLAFGAAALGGFGGSSAPGLIRQAERPAAAAAAATSQRAAEVRP